MVAKFGAPGNSLLGLADDNAVGKLQSYLAQQVGAERVELVERRLMSGGAIQQNWMLTGNLYGGADPGSFSWVLRTNAYSAVSVSMSRSQEYSVLKAVHEQGAKVPRPILLCEDPSIIVQRGGA